MTNGMDFNAIAAELVKEYGKDTFTENELTHDFYTDFYFKFQKFLPGNNPREALEAFWLNGGKEWLMTPKGDNEVIMILMLKGRSIQHSCAGIVKCAMLLPWPSILRLQKS